MSYLKSCIDNNKMLSRNFFLGFRYTGLKLVTDIQYLSMLSKLFSFAGFVHRHNIPEIKAMGRQSPTAKRFNMYNYVTWIVNCKPSRNYIRSDEGLTLETSALKLFTVAYLRYELSW